MCVALGFALHKYTVGLVHNLLGVSGSVLIKSPSAFLRTYHKGWDTFETQEHTTDHQAVFTRRFAETGLLPLVIEGKRLSDFYPAARFGGAITSVGTAIVILDRIGSLYRYNPIAGSFSTLQIPKLPNNLDSYLLQRAALPYGLDDFRAQDEFRAHDIVFLADRNELAVAYDKFDPQRGTLNTAVSIIKIDVATLSATGGWQEVFIGDAYAPADGIFSGGGRMAYGHDGTLYLTLGDHFKTIPKVSQDPNSSFGKIIAIDLQARRYRIFTSGHRNPQGLAFLKSGQLVSTEHGPRGGDELNVIIEGRNYGWPNVTLGTAYDSYDWDASTSRAGDHSGYTAPLFAWVPSVGISQLMEVDHFDPRWNGDLLVGSLKGMSLFRLRLENARVLYSEPIWIGHRIRDIVELENGMIALWTDDTELLFLTVDKDQLSVGRRLPNIVGNTIVESMCMACHHFGLTNPADFAPSLSNLLNRPIASDTFRYSAGLRAKQGNWTKSSLTEFLSNPNKFANGTNMPFLAMEPGQIKDIVDILARASSSASAP
jgi:cytochrome c2